jgi:hypothetical protein
MRPILRILSNAATLLSLVLCVATAVLWVRSCLACDSYFYSRFEDEPPWVRWFQGHLQTGRGGIGCTWSVQALPLGSRANLERRYPSPSFKHVTHEPAYPDFKFDHSPVVYGFNFAHFANPPTMGGSFPGRPGSSGIQLIVPLWCLLLAFALIASPGVWSWNRRRRNRRRRIAHRCTACGYDLRATPERCPECGTIPA